MSHMCTSRPLMVLCDLFKNGPSRWQLTMSHMLSYGVFNCVVMESVKACNVFNRSTMLNFLRFRDTNSCMS